MPPTTATSGRAAARAGPTSWLRQRSRLGASRLAKFRASRDMMQRLKLEASLEGHRGAVNCLEWSASGDLLASGADDRAVIVWDAYRAARRHTLTTGHQAGILSVKFMRGQQALATCSRDGALKLTDLATGKNLLDCTRCHLGRLEQLATHSNQPHLVWSAGEDGQVLQCDIRVPHQCNSRPKHLLVDLKSVSDRLRANCLAANPARDEVLAVGSNDIYCRLFDRRYSNRSSAQFAPGHLHAGRPDSRPNHLQSYGTTYLSFSATGEELLASLHAEQIYLFNVREPRERYKSFDVSLKPILVDAHRRAPRAAHPLPAQPNPDPLLEQAARDSIWSLEVFQQLNELIAKHRSCADLYRWRARALANRNWRGDAYQALRDCCTSLLLQPLDHRTLDQLAAIVCQLGYKDSADGLLDHIETVQRELEPQSARHLDHAATQLRAFKHRHERHAAAPPASNQVADQDGANRHSERRQVSLSNSSASKRILRQAMPLFRQLLAGAELSFAELNLLANFEGGAAEGDRGQRRPCQPTAYDYDRRFCGHCNVETDIAEANFFGLQGEFIVGASDDGAYYVWDKTTTNLVKAVQADRKRLSCVQPHPAVCLLASAGLGQHVSLWSARGVVECDVEPLDSRCALNQERMSADPLEEMIAMLYQRETQ